MFDSQVFAFALVAAILTMFGVCSGLYAHALLSALGVSVILMHSATAFTVLKIAGACYLVWLGIQSLRSAGRTAAAPEPADADAVRAPALRSFREGILWLTVVALLVDRSRQFFMKPRQRRLIDAACGTLLVALGFRLAWQQQ